MKETKAINKQLKKHVNAIHCSNEISLLQRKLFNALTFVAYPNLNEQQLFHIPTKELCRLIGYKSNDIGKLRDALSTMMSTIVHWNIVVFDNRKNENADEKTLYWEASTMVAAARIKDGICSFEFSSILKERLYHPDRYARLDLDIISKLKSKYGIALYENCVRFQNLKYTPWFEIEDFRTIMGANILDDRGRIVSKKYTNYKDFKKRILNPGIKEVNAHTNIFLELEEEKDHKKSVVKIRFKQFKQSDETVEIPEDINAIFEQLNLSGKTSEKLLQKHDKEYLKEKASLVLGSNSYKHGKIKDISSYYVSAVKDDYKETSRKPDLQMKEELKKDKFLQKHKESIKQKYKQYLDEVYAEIFAEYSENNLEKAREDFLKQLKERDGIRYTMYEKFGLENPIINDLFKQYILTVSRTKARKVLTEYEFTDKYISSKITASAV